MGRAFSIIVLCGAVGVLQFHGIAFWSDKVGPVGYLWSVLLEATALWLWYQRNVQKRALGLLASAMLLFGPLHQVAIPVLQEMESARHTDAARVAQIAIVRAEISNLERSLETFRKNSEARTGWLGPIQQNEQRLSEARQTLGSLLDAPVQSALDWSQHGVVLMQGAALVLFQITAVLIITSLSSVSRNSSEKKPLESGDSPVETVLDAQETPQKRPDTPDVSLLSERLEKYLAQQNLAAKEFAARHKLNARDISLIRNHSRRAAEGKQVAPPGAVRRVAEILESCNRRENGIMMSPATFRE